MKPSLKIFLLILTGTITGFVNGFFGGGGGMIVVPMLALALKMKPKIAHATAIAIILPVCFVSGIAYIAFGSLEWGIALPVTGGFVVGGIIGALLLKKIKAKWIVKIFAFIILAAGIKLLFF